MLLRLLQAFADHGDGFELRHADGERRAVLARDADRPWLCGIDFLRGDQLLTHEVFASRARAVDGAIAAGYRAPPG